MLVDMEKDKVVVGNLVEETMVEHIQGKIIIQEMEADSQVVGDLHGGRTVLVQLQEDKLWMVHQQKGKMKLQERETDSQVTANLQ